jgi:RNA polymerase primary sigma factor
MELPQRRRLLTSAEEIRLAKRIERGDLHAKDEMVERNLPLVVSVARRYRGRGVPFDDLVQEGTVGLVRAVELFDHRRGLRFSTYADWWIRRSVMNALGGARTIRIPAAAGRRLARLRVPRPSFAGSPPARRRSRRSPIGPGSASGR